jgi:putative ABC transport system substrate-binding protein
VRRREFIALFSSAAASWPLAASAQQGQRMRRIGLLMAYSQDDAEAQKYVSAFRDALKEFDRPQAA